MPTDQRKLDAPTPPPLFVRGAFEPESVNDEDRTVEVVFSTGAAVKRWRFKPGSWQVEEYEQSLEISDEAIDAEFLNSGRAPFLDAHKAYSLDAVLGVIVGDSLSIDAGKEARVRVRFDETDLAERRFGSVKNGILRNVSVGFNIEKNTITREADEKKGILEELTATRWKPLEVSQVPIGADQGATVREARAYAARQIQSQPEEAMPNDKTNNPEQLSAEERAKIASEARAEGAKIEAARQSGIRLTARTLRFEESDDAVAALLGDPTITLDAARGTLIDAAAARDEKAETSSTRADVTVGSEESQKRGEAIANALMHRAFPQSKDKDGAQIYTVERGSLEAEYVHRSLIDIARDCLERSGVDTRFMSNSRIAETALGMGTAQSRAAGMISTSDFPLVLADVAAKSLRMGYDMTPRTFTPWTRQVTANDFKTIRRIQLSGGLGLAEVEQGGEFTYGHTFEGQETYSLATFGRIVAITRQTLIDDDLDAFSRVSQIYGAAAADLESDTVYNLLTNNAAMADEIDLFDIAAAPAGHQNIMADGGAPTAARFGEGRLLMKRQTDLDDDRLLNIAPRFVIFPAAHETTMDQQLMLIQANAVADNVPAFVRSLVPIAEPRLDDNSPDIWYMAAEPTRIDTIEYAYLAGETGVQISTKAGWEVDGVEVKARLDFGAGVLDHRGLVRNPGV